MSHRPARPRSPRPAWRTVLAVPLTLALLGLTGVAGAAASVATTSDQTPRSPTSGAKAWVRVAHLVPGLGAARLDLQPAGGGRNASIQMSPSAKYGDVTPYQQLEPGAYTIRVSNSGDPASAQPMLSRSLTIAGDQAYTLAVLGTSQTPRLATLSDDLTPPAAGQARVRVLSAASQAPQVTVTAEGGPTLVQNAVLGEATGYAAVPAGTWKLSARISADLQVQDAIKVAGGSVYTLVLLDGDAGTPRLTLITDAAGASVPPQGGAATGGGATAADVVGADDSPVGFLVLAASVLLMLTGSIRLVRHRAVHR